MLTAQPPFVNTQHNFYERLLKNPVLAMQRRNIQINESALDLIAKMLGPDPENRIKIDQILIHPWI
jgi:serine/threonine protein kinase